FVRRSAAGVLLLAEHPAPLDRSGQPGERFHVPQFLPDQPPPPRRRRRTQPLPPGRRGLAGRAAAGKLTPTSPLAPHPRPLSHPLPPTGRGEKSIEKRSLPPLPEGWEGVGEGVRG